MEVESDNDNVDHSKIEPTKAEAEAIDRGLQVLVHILEFMPIPAAVCLILVLAITPIQDFLLET